MTVEVSSLLIFLQVTLIICHPDGRRNIRGSSPTTSPEKPSPLGELFVDATAKGALEGKGYYGYDYRILKAQGKDAAGGAMSYLVRGRMIAGFALIAWPVKYGDTGVMTFVINQAGQVYQKDLGPNTTALAKRIQAFNPDPSWSKVVPAK